MNSKYYEIYLNKYNYYQSLDYLINLEFTNYNNLKENFWKNKIDKIKGKTFNKYIVEELKEKIKNDFEYKFNDDDATTLINKYEKEIKSIKENKNFSFKENELDQIIKYISFANNHLKTSILYHKSNYFIFEKNIISWIKNIKRNDDNDFDLNDLNIINDINILIPVDIKYKDENFLVKLFNLLSSGKNDILKKKTKYSNISIQLENNYKINEKLKLDLKNLEIKKEININYIDFPFLQKEIYNIIEKALEFCENVFGKGELSQEFNELLYSNLKCDKHLLYSFYIFVLLNYENNTSINLSDDSVELENNDFLKELNDFIINFNKTNNCFSCNKKFYLKNEDREDEIEDKYCKYCQKIIDKKDYFLANLDDLKNIIEKLYYYIYVNESFYIGILYRSDVEKSFIYNNLFNININFNSEYTKNRIIIEEGDNFVLYKAELEVLNFGDKKFCCFKKTNKIISGKKNVEIVIDLLNLYNNCCCYYILTLPINFLEQMNLNENVRKKLKFVDLSIFIDFDFVNLYSSIEEENIFENISLFLINLNLNKNRINKIDNYYLNLLYLKLKSLNEKNSKSFPSIDCLNQFLFVINSCDSDNNEKIDLENSIKDIRNILGNDIIDKKETNNKEEKIEDEINISYLNLHFDILNSKEKNIFTNYEYLFKNMIINYKKTSTKKSFIKFFSEELIKYLEDTFKLEKNFLNEILSKECCYEDIYEKIDDFFQDYIKYTGYISDYDYDYHKYLKIISSCLTYAEDNSYQTDDYANSYIKQFLYDFEKIINSIDESKKDNTKHLFRQCINKFKILINEEEIIDFFFYKNYFDSFVEVFENYNDFNIPSYLEKYQQDLEKLEKYCKTLLEVEKYGAGKLYGNWESNDWKNGICEESEELNIYKEKYSIYHEKKVFKRARESLYEYYDDKVVGWKIESCKRDGTNGEWDLSFNPLLKKKFICDFTSQRFKSINFKVFVYLIKNPKTESSLKKNYKLGKIDEHEHQLVVTMANCNWNCDECYFKYCKNIPSMYCSVCNYNFCGECLIEKGYNRIISFPKDIVFSYKNVKDIIKKSESHEHQLVYCVTMRSTDFNGWRCNVCRKVFSSEVWSFYCTLCDFDQCCECFGIK